MLNSWLSLQKLTFQLFPELAERRDSYGHTASKWFQRYRKRLGFTERGKDFHSFRHTVADELKQKLVEDSVIKELLGHALDDISKDRYGKPYRPKVLLEKAVKPLDYGIDLSHLARSRFLSQAR